MIHNASLDTSFWNAANQIGVIPYLFSLFRVHYCTAVEHEIVTTNPDETPLIYPQAMMFQIMQEDNRLYRADPTTPLGLFGTGEAHAIALAIEHQWVVLLNDVRPFIYARALGLRCVSVPSFCVMLFSQGKITYAAVTGYLNRLRTITSPKLITEAQLVIDQLTKSRGKNG